VRTGRRELIRDLNQTLVLNLVREQGPISRADLARVSGLSASTVTEITAVLLRDGFLLEDALATGAARKPADRATLGRPATNLRVNPSAGHVVGLKLAAESLTAAVTNLAAEPLGVAHATHSRDADGASVAALFETVVAQALAAARVGRSSLFGIGIGVPGVVDPATGVVGASPLDAWTGADLAAMLGRRFQLPVYLDNDVNTLTVAEQLYGAGRGFPHFVVVTVGRGIGMGAVANGVVHRGAHGGAGEIGHVASVPDGPACWCGRRGCLEAVAAEPAIVRDILAATGRLLSPEDLADGAADPRIAAVLESAGRHLGRAIAIVATLLDPARVIVAGEGVRLGPVYLDGIRAGLAEHVPVTGEPELVVEPWGDEAWARGAATLVLRELFHPAHLRDEGAVMSLPRPDAASIRPGNSRLARVGQGGRR